MKKILFYLPCMKVLTFGEILWDIIEDQKHIGGAPLNFAAHFRQCGGESAVVSRLGKDDHGVEAFAAIKRLSVGTGMIQWDIEHPTGVVRVRIKDGSPTYDIVENVAYDYISAPDPAKVTDFEAFYFGTLAQRNSANRESLARILENASFKYVFYDVNLRKGNYSGDIIATSLNYCTIFKLNDEEVPVIENLLFDGHEDMEGTIHKLLNRFSSLKLVILTEGSRGCRVFDRSRDIQVPADKIKVKDTVGAGDSFSAAFLYTYQKTGDPEKAAVSANRVGGFVASQSGAVPSYSPDIKALLP